MPRSKLLDETVRRSRRRSSSRTNRFQGGAAPKSDVAQAQTQLDTTRAQATDVTVAAAQLEHAIATLIASRPRPSACHLVRWTRGRQKSRWACRPSCWSGGRTIAAAERRVAEANEQIGIAKAAYYPTVS